MTWALPRAAPGRDERGAAGGGIGWREQQRVKGEGRFGLVALVAGVSGRRLCGTRSVTRRLAAGLVGLGALLAGGCERQAASGRSDNQPDVLASAPRSWPELLRWAGRKLDGALPTVPIPDQPRMPGPRWPVDRLAAARRLAQARARIDWRPRRAALRPLVELRNLRSDQSSTRVASGVRRKFTPDGRDALVMAVGGFSVRRERVGAIELELRVPFGRHFVLQWGKAGQIVVPVRTHDGPFAVTIPTDGFAEWHGPLNKLLLIADGTGAGVLEVRRLAFLPHSDAFPEPFGPARVNLGDEIRSAIYMHSSADGPARLTFRRLRVPPRGRFSFGLGVLRPAEGSAHAMMRVRVGGPGQSKVLFEQRVDADGAWHDARIELGNAAGGRVDLTLEVEAPSGTVVFWGNPTVYQPVEEAPVVVIYLIDTVAAGHVSLYGYGRRTMPRLAQFAAGGVWFAQAFSNSPRTIESIPDLLFSMPTERHGVDHNLTPAPPGLVSLAEILRDAGFATVSFCTNVNAGPRQGMDQGFETFFDRIGYWWTHVDRTVPLEEADRWLAWHADRPMFLYVHTAEPHAPYTPPAGYAGRFDADYRGRFDGTYDRRRGFHRIRDRRRQARDVQHIEALYDEEILYADARFGMFLDLLAERGLKDRAWVFVVSDHGEAFLEHGVWEHGLDLHGEQTRIPLVTAGPMVRARGRVDVPVQLMDVMPTILDALDLPQPYPLDGMSLMPLLAGSRSEGDAVLRRRYLFGSNHNYRATQQRIEYYTIEDGRWKLLFSARPYAASDGVKSRFSLYDLSRDPGERRNLIAEQRDVARRLLEVLLRWRLGQRPYAHEAGPATFGAGESRSLQAMGYVGGTPVEPAARRPEGEPKQTESTP